MNSLMDAEVPPVPQDVPPGGVAWLRASVARFSNGDAHTRRRSLAIRSLATISVESLRERAFRWTERIVADPGVVDVMAAIARPVPVGVLATELGLPDVSADIAVVAPAYHPHVVPDAAAEAALARLVAACGGVADEPAAARIGVLIQACDATAGLIGNAVPVFLQGESAAGDVLGAVLDTDPPVRRTRRRIDGEDVVVELAGLPFGAGAKECPGRAHAVALATGVLQALSDFRLLETEIAYEPSANLHVPVRLRVTRDLSVGGFC